MKIIKCPLGSSELCLMAKKVAESLSRGSLIIVPTETVYGIACSTRYPKAYQKIYRLKKRDLTKRLSLHLGDKNQINFNISNPYFDKLSKAFWPGPLTMIVNHPTQKTIGLRYPDHLVFQSISQAFGEALFVSSANISSKQSPDSLASIPQSLLNAVDMAVDSGIIANAHDSTVIDLSCSKGFKILRQGSLSFKEIQDCLQKS